MVDQLAETIVERKRLELHAPRARAATGISLEMALGQLFVMKQSA